jgi:hypothetical protein
MQEGILCMYICMNNGEGIVARKGSLCTSIGIRISRAA